MIQISRDDLLRALKRCKGIAKQDLLPNSLIPQSDFRKAHAEARRETYTKLIEMVEGEGIENACVFAFSEYQHLPVSAGKNSDPSTSGHTQALEMFFNVIGLDADQLKSLQQGIQDFNQLLSFNPPFQNDLVNQSLAN